MNEVPIRVLLVDDSPLTLTIISRLLSRDPLIHVVAQAKNGLEAVQLLETSRPSIICTDYFMPKMNGLELTKHVMQHHPLPILVLSSVLADRQSREVFEVIEAGALDFMPKPKDWQDEGQAKALIEKIRILSRVVVFSRAKVNVLPSDITATIPQQGHYSIIVIGASTGGPLALLTILQALPADFHWPVLCIQHISKGFLKGFVDWLQAHCSLPIKIVNDSQAILPGTIYFPAEGQHMDIQNRQLLPSLADTVDDQRPSVTFTMQAVARNYGPEAIALLLTGMGCDGATGMEAIKRAGGMTIAQSERSCVVFGMPKVAISRGVVSYVKTPEEMAAFLVRMAILAQNQDSERGIKGIGK